MKLVISVEGGSRGELTHEALRVMDSFNKSVANVMGETIGFGAMWQLHPEGRADASPPPASAGAEPQVAEIGGLELPPLRPDGLNVLLKQWCDCHPDGTSKRLFIAMVEEIELLKRRPTCGPSQ